MTKSIVTLALLFVTALAFGCDSKSKGGSDSGGGGHPAMDTVAGGTVMTSESYRLVLTTGQGPGGNGVLSSESYRLQGGVIGATQ